MWANSGDLHFIEPDDLWASSLPKRLADLVPRAEKDPAGEWETEHVDSQSLRRKLPSSVAVKFVEDSNKPRGFVMRLPTRMKDDESALYEQPLEFMTSIANLGGGHDGQWVIPNDHGAYEVGCDCEVWLMEAPTQERGLELARMWTGTIPSDGSGRIPA